MNAVEFAFKAFQFDDNLPNELKKLEAEGFVQIPGLAPVVMYMVFRNTKPQEQPVPEPPPQGAGFGVMQIDDTKVHVIRGGEPVPT